MNVRIIVFSLFSLLLGLILYVGLFGFSFQEQSKFSTETTAENTFQFLTDPDYYPLWRESFIRYQRIQGQPAEEGTQNYLFTEEEGEEFTVIETYLEVNRPHKVVREYQHDFYTLTSTLEIVNQTGDSSQLIASFEISGSRFLENILLPLYAGSVLQEHIINYDKAIREINARYQ